MTRLTTILLIFLAAFTSCNRGKKGPDVSGIPVELTTLRFEKDFFAIDTTNPGPGLQALQQKYPGFSGDFFANILGIPPDAPTNDKLAAVSQFLRDYRPVKAEADKAMADWGRVENELKGGLQHLKYFFPDYKAPKQLITFIGPMDAYAEGATGGYGDIITTDALGVGLQLHLGAQSSFYTSEIGQRLYPSYISRRFEPNTIAVNCMKNIIDDMVPVLNDKSLLGIMVDKGRRLYILDQLMPDAPDSVKTGYTGEQLKGAFANEGLIWNFFLENNLVYETDPQKIKSYVGEGPKTVELGDGSPGYIALFTGRQILRAYMDKFPGTTMKELLALDARKILAGSAYKPR
jgi:hypothetical protein